MTPDFTATYLAAEDMDTYFIVGLSTHEHEPADYLAFQRAHEFDEQDVRFGLNAVHVERNDQGYSGYHGMRSVTLFSDRLHIEFNDKGLRFMGGLAATTVFFDFSGEVFESLRSGLHRVFRGYDCFHDNTIVA